MNVQLPVHLDKAGFLAWIQGREERYELAQGRVVMMVGASRAHGIMVLNLAALLRGQLDLQKWTVLAEFGLDAGPKTLRYPDIVVDRAGGALGDYIASEPVLLAEVLSPSTADIDLGDKAAEYLQVPSLLAYLVFSQDAPKVWSWQRKAGKFSAGPRVVTGEDKILRVGSLKVNLPLGAVYAGALMR
jgi:Uma2 family endonuclease